MKKTVQQVLMMTAAILLIASQYACNNGTSANTASTDAATAEKKDTVHCINPASRAGLMARTGSGDTGQLAIGQAKNIHYAIDTSNWPAKPWPAGMVWVPGGEYAMGGVGSEARQDEFPVHRVKVDGFWMDQTEVTVLEFKKFVKATGYVTVAEKKPEWNQLKLQLPPNTPKPDDASLVPGSLVFTPTSGPVPLDDYSRWWRYVPQANWKHPLGPTSDVYGTSNYDNHPVTQVCWFDVEAYCKWAHKRLPTEAEWEFASRGGLEGKAYSWGDEKPSASNVKANLWQGNFPNENKQIDGYVYTAPVKSYAPNGYGLYDIIGNVWEWCSDWYRPDTYTKEKGAGLVVNPAGPSDSYDPDEPYATKRVVRGGSYLCNEQYCSSYRPSARMKTDPYSGESHTGFRAVMTQAQWLGLQKQKQSMAAK
ncbi:formylglycine-generating enzyme family protein [Chitinophagaceae bacterium LWZ2-11]